ncbi:MAG: DinB family protein [Acidobacteriota bacterium]
MLNKDLLQELFRHMEWADALVWNAVLTTEGARTDAKIQEYLQHVHTVQQAFFTLWRAEPLTGQFPTFADAASLMTWGQSYYGDVHAYLAQLTPEAAAKPLSPPWAAMIEKRLGRPPGATTIAETALQVVLHTTYHRGQINARLRALGADPPLVDYIAWLWQERPAATWPTV